MMTTYSNQGATLKSGNARIVATWLCLVALLVFAMVILGGVTRLTNSGLSMVEWKPVTGWLPPIGTEAWDAEFEKYKAFPEYQKVNQGMSLSEFKGIFVFEYSHRLLGRAIGLAFFIPFVVLLLLRKIDRSLIPRLLFLFLLGGSQGAMGWIMVKSGLVDHPDVSHYRLTAHLGLACLIFIGLLWTAFDLLIPKRDGEVGSTPPLWTAARIIFGLVFLQILIGGFVAGLNAGFVYNEWPMMGDGFIPDDIFHQTPWYMNFLENTTTIQFTHRMVAYALLATVIWLFLKARSGDVTRRLKIGIHLLLCATLLQVLLGIWTLVAVVPVILGALHQAGGLLVLGAVTLVVHQIKVTKHRG
ncbi:MAG: COX15/CtaA family protein [Sneathiella sp.]